MSSSQSTSGHTRVALLQLSNFFGQLTLGLPCACCIHFFGSGNVPLRCFLSNFDLPYSSLCHLLLAIRVHLPFRVDDVVGGRSKCVGWLPRYLRFGESKLRRSVKLVDLLSHASSTALYSPCPKFVAFFGSRPSTKVSDRHRQTISSRRFYPAENPPKYPQGIVVATSLSSTLSACPSRPSGQTSLTVSLGCTFDKRAATAQARVHTSLCNLHTRSLDFSSLALRFLP